MAIRLSPALANDLATAFKTAFQGGFVGIFSGGQPPDPTQAETGSLLVIISKASGTAGITWGTAGGGVLPNSADIMSGLCGTAGIAGWFRLYDSNLTMGSNGTAVRMDGNVGVSGSDLVLANTNMVVGATQTIIQAAATEPQS